MALMKFSTGLLFSLMFTACFSVAQLHTDGVADADIASVSKGTGVFATKEVVGGRKTMVLDVKARFSEKVMKVMSNNGVTEQISMSSSTGSHAFAGKCQGKKMHSNSKLCKKSSVSHEDVVDKGFVAFNADYHAPRHHPPKNN